MKFEKITESDSLYNKIENKTITDILSDINREDAKVASAVNKVIPQITALIEQMVPRMKAGGRIFYVGAGTSGRLGIVDASECPPTFGVPHGWVNGIMAGGDGAIRKAVEFAEDSYTQAWNDLEEYEVGELDTIIGIAASGTTPYVIGAIEKANASNILTGGISCNPGSPLHEKALYPISPVVGPEYITGSTRMKSGTAQKLILNMISTTLMIKLGKVEDNKMVDMQLSNNKLVDRGTKMVMKKLKISYEKANELLKKHGSVREAIANGK